MKKSIMELLFLGWTVIRFWGDEIKKNVDECVRVVEETIFELKLMMYWRIMKYSDSKLEEYASPIGKAEETKCKNAI